MKAWTKRFVSLTGCGEHPGAGRFATLGGLLLLTAAACMPVQEREGDWRTVSWARPAVEGDTLPLSASVNFMAGRFSMRAVSGPELYSASLTWDANVQVEPAHSFNDASRELEIGLGSVGMDLPDAAGAGEGRLRLSLSRSVPLRLEANLAGTASDLDLTGMNVASAVVSSRMGDVRIHLEEPNAVEGSVLNLDNRFGRMVAVRLANANADSIRVNSDFGTVDLDFSGRWTRNLALELDATAGDIKLRVPAGIGIEVELDNRWRGAPDGWESYGNRMVSPNWAGARHRLSVRGRTTLARLAVIGA